MANSRGKQAAAPAPAPAAPSKKAKKKAQQRAKQAAAASNQPPHSANATVNANAHSGAGNKAPGGHQQDDDDDVDDDELPGLEAIDSFPMQAPALSPSGASVNAAAANLQSVASAAGSALSAATMLPHATQSELLATANDLYRQIESAAAAALAGAPGGPNGSLARGLPGADEAVDDAYWLSLPSHLRSFIKNALPIAAGLSTGNGTGGTVTAAQANAAAQALNLTPEQMHQAAQQLAQVVQSTGWAALGVNPPGGNAGGARTTTTSNSQGINGTTTTTTTTTIPLGSFTLPLHPHPDHRANGHYDLEDDEEEDEEEEDDEEEDDEDDELLEGEESDGIDPDQLDDESEEEEEEEETPAQRKRREKQKATVSVLQQPDLSNNTDQ